MSQISKELKDSLEMALCNLDASTELENDLNTILENDLCISYLVEEAVTCVTNATYVGSYKPIIIPGGTFLKGFIIVGSAPAGTAGGAKTVQYSVGTAPNAGINLAGAGEADVMIATGAIVASASVHGDTTGDNAAGYFADVPFGVYIASDTVLYVNYIGLSAGATATPGKVNVELKVYAMVSKLI